MHPILADRRRLQLHLVAWGLVGALLGLLVRTIIGTPWFDTLLFALPLGLIAAPISLSAWYLVRATPASRTAAWRIAITAVGAATVTSALWAALGHGWWRLLERAGFDLAGREMRSLDALLVGLGGLAYLLSVTVHYMLQASGETAAAARRALEAQIAHREAELRALRAQIDPHFLFNSLNSIAGLIGVAPDKARTMCQLLADFLRDSLTLGKGGPIPLSREIALAEQYLRIEEVRFGSRLQVKSRIDAACADVPVPALILQPLVENAVRHGIATLLDGGTIEIEATLAGPRAFVVVRNPRDADVVRRGTGFGLDIVRRRLITTFGEHAALAIEAEPERYRVSVTIPVEAGDEQTAGEERVRWR